MKMAQASRAKGRRGRERGVALIMVLLSIVVLTVFLTEVQEQSATAFAGAIGERDRLRAEYHARSAVNLARLLIATEPKVRKAVEPIFRMLNPKGKAPQIPVWEFVAEVLGPFNDAAGAESFSALTKIDAAAGEKLGLGGPGRFEVVIVDEDSKLNVNVGARGDIISRTRLAQQLLGLIGPAQYNPMFEATDLDEQLSDRQTICREIIDWTDSDTNLEPCDPSASAPASGAEDNYYQTIGLPYFRKNAAFDSLDELRLVRGISDDFWATFVDPDPRDPKKRVMTVWGQGKINVNSANAQTLLALVCGGAPDAELCTDVAQASAFLSVVTLVRSMTAGAPLFSSAADFIAALKGKGLIGPHLATLGVKPVKFRSEAEMKKIVTTESKMFSIYAVGVVPGRGGDTRTSIHAVADFRKSAVLGEGIPVEPDGKRPSPDAKPDEGRAPSPEELVSILAADPGGKLVYWRVE
ncbi:MAG: general secretion pathway protein GspK [Myxococcales bacterium]|nr:general secretion pathway protein GspK [Myxococcales bacterium]